MNKIKELEKPTNDSFVPKPRSLITISRSELTITEAKILNYFIWKHFKREQNGTPRKSSDKSQEYYVTSIAEIREMIQYVNRSTQRLIDSLYSLTQKSAIYDVFSIDFATNSITKCAEGAMSFLDFVEIQESEKRQETKIVYSLGKKFLEKIEMMINGKEQYYSFDYNILAAFSSKYGLALYELLKLYEHNDKSLILEINDNLLHFLGAPKSYKKNFYDLKKRVFNPGIEQVNLLTSLNVSYEIFDKKGRKYLHIKRGSTSSFPEIFSYAATHIYKAKNPKAYAKTLAEKYKKGEIDPDKFEEWKKEYRKFLQKEEEKKELLDLNKRLHQEIASIYARFDPKINDELLYIKVPYKGAFYEIKLSELYKFEQEEPGVVKKVFSAFEKAESKEDFVKKFIIWRLS